MNDNVTQAEEHAFRVKVVEQLANLNHIMYRIFELLKDTSVIIEGGPEEGGGTIRFAVEATLMNKVVDVSISNEPVDVYVKNND